MADDEVPDVLGVEFDEGELHFAAQEGDITRVRELLAAGQSPNAFDEIAKTPLHYAAESGHIDIMRVLLEGGADVNANDEARIGNTPLRDVADECSLAVAKCLVDAGADPRIPGWMQLTALDKAEERKDEEGQPVYALLKSVADRLGDC
jgi:ankyrin repeat protein